MIMTRAVLLSMLLFPDLALAISLDQKIDNLVSAAEAKVKSTSVTATACPTWCDQRWHQSHELCQGCSWAQPSPPPSSPPIIGSTCCASPVYEPMCIQAAFDKHMCVYYPECHWVCTGGRVSPTPVSPTPQPPQRQCFNDPSFGMFVPNPGVWTTCDHWNGVNCALAGQYGLNPHQVADVMGHCPLTCNTCSISKLAAQVAELSGSVLSEAKIAELTHAKAVELAHAMGRASPPALHANHTQLAAVLLKAFSAK
jgi:hypothetical protein